MRSLSDRRLPVSEEEEEVEECARGIQVEFRLRESVLFFLVPQRERERKREGEKERSAKRRDVNESLI